MNILWLKTELLHPVNRGGRIRTYNMLRELKRTHHITYLTLDDGTGAPDADRLAAEYCDELDVIPFRTTPKDSPRLLGDLLVNLFSRLPYAVAKYASAEMTQRLRRRIDGSACDIVVCDFLFPSQNVPRDLPIPTILFQHNVEAAIWKRHTDVAGSRFRKLYFAEQWRRMERFERHECRRFDHVVAVSEEDASALRTVYGLSDVSWVPTGVDTAYFTPSGTNDVQSHELVFTGALDWLPNEDAILYFADAILPTVRSAVPDVTLTIVGRNPTARIREVAARHSALNLVGQVPDVRPFIDRAAAFVVPMRIGGGTRLKIFEAMAMGKPVVTTAIGAEGLPVADNLHARFGDTPQEFAQAVISVLNEPDVARRLSEEAATFVRANFGWNRVAMEFADICSTVVAGAGR
jgi:glycosyltransferase involved in cell wall biosynthesis